jgi:hypothetical protein
MATPEFKETGQTQNQRLHRMGSTKPPSPGPGASGANKFVTDFLSKAPGANDSARAALGITPPGPRAGEDFSLGELMDVAEMLLPRRHTMSSEQAGQLTRLVSGLRGGSSG